MPTSFTPEQGRQPLAEALFAAARFRIRCPQCPGNINRPGHIKDEAGKCSADHSRRRFWACQRSNGKGIRDRCRRISCTEYIHLAQAQLPAAEFSSIVAAVLADHPATSSEHALLQSYLSTQSTPAQTLLAPAFQPNSKRKAEAHDGPQPKRVHAEPSSSPLALFTTSSPAATWQSALDQLHSRILVVEREVSRLVGSTSPSSSPPPPLRLCSSSPPLSPRSSPRLRLASSPPSSPLPPVTLALPTCKLRLDDTVGSHETLGPHTTPLRPVAGSSPTPTHLLLDITRPIEPSPGRTPAKVFVTASPIVTNLVERFRQTPSKSTIRLEAQREGVYGAFQQMLRQSCSESAT